MNTDVVIIGAGPAGIFTALEMLKKGSRKRILIVEKGKAVEDRHCPKEKTKKCVNCKPYCHITTGFSGAGAFSDGKLSLSYEVGGDLPTLIGEEKAQETIHYTDQIYLEFGADTHIEGLEHEEERKAIRVAGIRRVRSPGAPRALPRAAAPFRCRPPERGEPPLSEWSRGARGQGGLRQRPPRCCPSLADTSVSGAGLCLTRAHAMPGLSLRVPHVALTRGRPPAPEGGMQPTLLPAAPGAVRSAQGLRVSSRAG